MPARQCRIHARCSEQPSPRPTGLCGTGQARSRYEENVYPGNHTWWKEGQWGYACCHQTLKQSYCTGEAGKRAEAAAEQRMADNLAARAKQIEDGRINEAAEPAQVGSQCGVVS